MSCTAATATTWYWAVRGLISYTVMPVMTSSMAVLVMTH